MFRLCYEGGVSVAPMLAENFSKSKRFEKIFFDESSGKHQKGIGWVEGYVL